MCAFDGRVISNFVLQALRNEPITLFGDGSQTRSFCYVDDLVEGLIRLMNCEDFTGPVNLGNTSERTIKSVAELTIELTGSSSQIIYHPIPQDGPLRRRPDISLAQQTLNWKPTVPLKKGLPKVIEYFRPISQHTAPPNKRPI